MIKKILFAVILMLGIAIFMIQYPNLFIKKVGEYKNFTIYSNQEIKLNYQAKSILDSVQENLNQSEFAKESEKIELYFIRGTLYEKLLRLFGRKNIAFSKFNKHIYSAYPNFEEGTLSRNDNEYEWLNLVQIISHEGVHSQMYQDYYGFLRMKTPSWINEGYAEYISYMPIRSHSSYDIKQLFFKLEKSEGDWLKTEYNSMTPRVYTEARLLIEYLIDVKGRGIRDIIEDERITPNELYEEIREYCKE